MFVYHSGASRNGTPAAGTSSGASGEGSSGAGAAGPRGDKSHRQLIGITVNQCRTSLSLNKSSQSSLAATAAHSDRPTAGINFLP